tara:strand:+ start:217 stop:420 length:204 start_codon:yes stop_codon:yes gene_type:complete
VDKPQEVATLTNIAYKSKRLVYFHIRLYNPEKEKTINCMIVKAGNHATKTAKKFSGISNSNRIKKEI